MCAKPLVRRDAFVAGTRLRARSTLIEGQLFGGGGVGFGFRPKWRRGGILKIAMMAAIAKNTQ
ncbi:hypothetical protein KCP73_03300 [Salmonella enterica subsp. enterica]|nr:hypothetical protein KCP73_03300 [Salmonella enterica subsp. enterica]